MANDKEILSQDEVDSLIHGVEDVDLSDVVEQQVEDGDVISYDLVSQDRIVRSRMPTLEIINEKFARFSRSQMFTLLRNSVDIDITGIEVMKYADYMYSLPVPTSINMVKAHPLKGTALIVLDSNLIFKMVDQFYGGVGRHIKIEGREFTKTEQVFVEKVVGSIFNSMKDAWSSVINFEFEYESMEVNPHMANSIAPAEVMVVSKFMLETATGKGELSIAFPYSMLEPVKDILIYGYKNNEDQKDDRWLEAFQNDMLCAPLPIDVKVAEKTMKLSDVINLKAGDILPVHLEENITLFANKVPLIKGKMGTKDGNLAMQVEEFIKIKHIK